MIEKISIEEEKCIGCGKCVNICSHSVLEMVDGKAKVVSDIFCDGLAKCVGECPSDAIHIEKLSEDYLSSTCIEGVCDEENYSLLFNWPTKLAYVPIESRYFTDCNLLISADCCGYAHGRFHDDFLDDYVLLTTCPKSLNSQEILKLTQIISKNKIKKIKVIQMEVPCCFNLYKQVHRAMNLANKKIPLEVVKIRINGSIKKD